MIILTKTGYIRKGAFSRNKGSNKVPAKQMVFIEPEIDPKKLCPCCGLRERNLDPNGSYRSYCHECRKEYSNAAYHKRKVVAAKPRSTLCARCGKEPKQKPGDRHNSYCHGCRKELNRESYARIKQKKQRNSTNSLTQ